MLGGVRSRGLRGRGGRAGGGGDERVAFGAFGVDMVGGRLRRKIVSDYRMDASYIAVLLNRRVVEMPSSVTPECAFQHEESTDCPAAIDEIIRVGFEAIDRLKFLTPWQATVKDSYH